MCELISQAGRLGYSIPPLPQGLAQEWAIRFNPGAHTGITGRGKLFFLFFFVKVINLKLPVATCGESPPKNVANTEAGQAKRRKKEEI